MGYITNNFQIYIKMYCLRINSLLPDDGYLKEVSFPVSVDILMLCTTRSNTAVKSVRTQLDNNKKYNHACFQEGRHSWCK